MTDQPEIEITMRPFLGELLSPTPTSAATPNIPQPSVPENHHLLAAVTGTARPLHIVDEEDVEAARTQRDAAALGNSQGTGGELRSRGWRRELASEAQAAGTSTPRISSERSQIIEPSGYLQVDWNLVRQLTRELTIVDTSSEADGGVRADNTVGRSRSAFDVAIASAGPEDETEERTMVEIKRIIDRHTTRIAGNQGSDHDWSPLKVAHYTQAIFDQAHRYGRLQQYLREPDVEDISIVGYSNVVVTKTNGLRERRSPVADDDRELEDLISEIASHRGRTFTKPNGRLDLDIGGARMSATGVQSTSQTNVTIRKHNLVDVTLADMVANRTISKKIAAFLSAASRANLCVIVGGFPAAGKTTLLRALTSEIRPEEKISTIETERELYLNKLPNRHWQVQDLQYIPQQSAVADSAAVLSLDQCLHLALRASVERIIFAEIKGPEGPIAMQAMEAGKGSMSTIHARSAQHTIRRLAIVLMREQGLSDDTVPLTQIGDTIDLILYIDKIENADGTIRRVVTEVAEVVPNLDNGRPMTSNLFQYDLDSEDWTCPEKPSLELRGRLRRVGYDWDKEAAG